MSELSIRRNRGYAVAQRQETGKGEKAAPSGKSQQASKVPGFTVSETLRQLMTRGSQTEGLLRESRRTLQAGEAALTEVQSRLGRIAELAQESAGGGEPDRAALQSELDQLRREIDRIMDGAVVDGARLFLDDGADLEGSLEALLYAVTGGASAPQDSTQPLPDWLTDGMAQNTFTPEQLLTALGLDKTASGEEILAAVKGASLEGGSAAGYLAALYLGAVIAGGESSGSVDLQQAAAGLRLLLDKVAEGMPPDQAIQLLTGGAFTSFADFQSQFTGGTAPGLQDFLVHLLLSDSAVLLPSPSLLPALEGLQGMNLELLMGLLDTTQSSQPGPDGAAQSVPTPLPAKGAAAGSTEGPAAEQSQAPAVSLELGGVRVSGQDLSGVSLRAASGELVIGGQADVTIQGQGEPAIVITGSGSVTLRNVQAAALTVDSPGASLLSAGESALELVRLRPGAALTLGGSGLLHIGALRAGQSNTLRLTGGAVAVGQRGAQGGQTMGALPLPVVMEAPASLAARPVGVYSPSGKPMEPFDIIWKTLLPGWSALTAVSVNGRQAHMSLLGGDYPALVRLWLEKGDGSQGYPAHALAFQGRDECGRPRTRYAYLRWNQRAGAFEETAMYPNPFTVTGGEPGLDWVYEEESHTLRILSGQVTALSGGTGTDANQVPFSGRVALADGIGAIGLTLDGVVCRVSQGQAFSLGRENDVSLILQRGSSNVFESGAGCAGISLGDGTSLCIDCVAAQSSRTPDGALTATGGDGGAGIGRDSDAGRDRTSRIVIRGGVITATGSGGGAGIGAGRRGWMGSITILGGTVTSTGGRGGGAGIGAALGAPAGDISIRGGRISAAAAYHAAAIGAAVQGESGDILIDGTARIVSAQGGNPGADIGACLFGGCGRVLLSGGADIGTAKLWTRTGLSLHMGEDAVTLPQFRLSSRALRLDSLSVATREYAQSAGVILDADRRWVSQIQSAYGALYGQLEQGFSQSCPTRGQTGPLRDNAAAGTLLRDTRKNILRQSAQAVDAYHKWGTEDVWQLLW